MTAEPSFLIVGGGLAGAIAAQTLREECFDGRITLLGEEPHRPYERPPCPRTIFKATLTSTASSCTHSPGTSTTRSTFVWALQSPRSTQPRGPSPPPPAQGCATTGCCWPPVRHRDASACRAPTSTACITCATSRTATASRP